jgi:hypothetical protein
LPGSRAQRAIWFDLVTTPDLREKQATAAQSQSKAQAAQAAAKEKEDDKEGEEGDGEEEIGSMMSDAELGASFFLNVSHFIRGLFGYGCAVCAPSFFSKSEAATTDGEHLYSQKIMW